MGVDVGETVESTPSLPAVVGDLDVDEGRPAGVARLSTLRR